MKCILIIFCILGAGNVVISDIRQELNEELADAFLMVPEVLKKYGYPVEVHEVTTRDGYLLTMHRIPGNMSVGRTKSPVLIMHGLHLSSADFVILGPGKSLAYLLADVGYDVWLGNSRGNTYSRDHIHLDPNEREFWHFSWHEIGVYDLPAMIDYVLNITASEKLSYIGYSQGTTIFYVMASELPVYNEKVHVMVSLAPVVFMSNIKSLLFRMFSCSTKMFQDLWSMLEGFELNVRYDLFTKFFLLACGDRSFTQLFCYGVKFIVCGFNYEQKNTSVLPIILGHSPTSASVMQLLHFAQLVYSGNFQQYDHGSRNLLVYGQHSTPVYDLKRVTAPVVLMYGVNDWLSDLKDVEKLMEILPNVILKYEVPHSQFNHLDFIYAKDVDVLVYFKVLEVLSQY